MKLMPQNLNFSLKFGVYRLPAPGQRPPGGQLWVYEECGRWPCCQTSRGRKPMAWCLQRGQGLGLGLARNEGVGPQQWACPWHGWGGTLLSTHGWQGLDPGWMFLGWEHLGHAHVWLATLATPFLALVSHGWGCMGWDARGGFCCKEGEGHGSGPRHPPPPFRPCSFRICCRRGHAGTGWSLEPAPSGAVLDSGPCPPPLQLGGGASKVGGGWERSTCPPVIDAGEHAEKFKICKFQHLGSQNPHSASNAGWPGPRHTTKNSKKTWAAPPEWREQPWPDSSLRAGMPTT